MKEPIEPLKTHPKREPQTVQVGFRLPRWLVEKIDALAELESQEMGRAVTRTDMAAWLMLKGIGAGNLNERLQQDVLMAKKHLAICASAAAQQPTPQNERELSFAIQNLREKEVALDYFRRQQDHEGREK